MSVIQINLEIVGLGIIFYSPYAVKSIREGEPYLMRHYNEPQDVLEHIYKGIYCWVLYRLTRKICVKYFSK